MNLNDALKVFEGVEANLGKLDRIWADIRNLLPSGNTCGLGDPEKYLQFKRSFEHIAKAMPQIDGFALAIKLFHPDDLIRYQVDCLELDDFDSRLSFNSDVSEQGEILNEYRFRLESKRRQLARQAVADACSQVESKLIDLQKAAKKRKSNASMPKRQWQELGALFKTIDALLGSLPRPPRWGDMARHLAFGVRQDYQDIVEHDWPSIRQGLERSLYGENDPIPTSATDLGAIANAQPQGEVSTALSWTSLSPIDFERLIFNLIDRTISYENPQWLTHTNAPDKGRDLSVERVIQDPLTGTRRLRIILACKHTDSVNVSVISVLKEQMKLWEPPRVDELIVVTSGRFTNDAVDYIERHNRGQEAMRIEMWPSSHLERLLASRPELIAEFGLRK